MARDHLDAPDPATAPASSAKKYFEFCPLADLEEVGRADFALILRSSPGARLQTSVRFDGFSVGFTLVHQDNTGLPSGIIPGYLVVSL